MQFHHNIGGRNKLYGHSDTSNIINSNLDNHYNQIDNGNSASRIEGVGVISNEWDAQEWKEQLDKLTKQHLIELETIRTSFDKKVRFCLHFLVY